MQRKSKTYMYTVIISNLFTIRIFKRYSLLEFKEQQQIYGSAKNSVDQRKSVVLLTLARESQNKILNLLRDCPDVTILYRSIIILMTQQKDTCFDEYKSVIFMCVTCNRPKPLLFERQILTLKRRAIMLILELRVNHEIHLIPSNCVSQIS